MFNCFNIYLFYYPQWEEVGNGIWCCPIKVKAAVRNATSRTALACNLLSIFYPKKDLQGKRLQELDQDVIEAIIGKIYPLLLHEYGMYSFFSQCEIGYLLGNLGTIKI